MKIKTLALTAILVCQFIYLKAQNCESYFPMKVGASWETKSYDAKDKLTGTNNSKIIKCDGTTDLTATVSYESLDNKNASVGTGEYLIKCSNGVFSVNMKSMLNSKTLEAYKDMQITITGDDVEMPNNPTVGQTLKDATLTLTVTGMAMMNLTIKIYNRKVAAIESVTTPAGTFANCVKITYNATTTMMFTVQTSGSEWYAKNVGMVKSESFDDKGKKAGSSVLTSIKQ